MWKRLQTYFNFFEYDDNMNLWLRRDGSRMMELSVSITRHNTREDGTNFCIDDFSIIKIY